MTGLLGEVRLFKCNGMTESHLADRLLEGALIPGVAQVKLNIQLLGILSLHPNVGIGWGKDTCIYKHLDHGIHLVILFPKAGFIVLLHTLLLLFYAKAIDLGATLGYFNGFLCQDSE